MAYNDRYWTKKEQMAKRAKEHTAYMEQHHGEEIKESVRKSKIYSPNSVFTSHEKESTFPEVIMCNMTSDTAAVKYRKGSRTCILNFASFKNPGGRFLGGSTAQEESLCHASALYSVLKEFKDYYKENTKNLSHGLYTNRAIYSPQVPFDDHEKEHYFVFDVLTCAAPNLAAARRQIPAEILKDKNSEALRSRIQFIKKIAEENEVSTLILGAWGCGVFAQDPNEIAALFTETFKKTSIERIVYAIPGNMDDKNYRAFSSIVKRKAEN